MEKLLAKDFKYHIDYEFDIERTCEDSGCYDIPAICRCATLKNIKITNVDIESIINDIYNIYFEDDESTRRDYKLKKLIYKYDKLFDIYVIDRIVRHYKIWNSDNFDISLSNGYYGEEISCINLKKGFIQKICDKIEDILSLNSIKSRIEELLIMEYGYIIPELVDKDFEIIEICKDDIHFGNKEHLNKVKEKNLEFYRDENYKGIRGIVYFDGKYRVIDGYHRINTSNKSKIKVINVKEEY